MLSFRDERDGSNKKTKQITERKQKNLHHMTQSGNEYLSRGPTSLELKINKGRGC